MFEISVEEVKRKLDAGEPVHLIDVREAEELEICRLDGAEHIPMMSLFTGIQQTEAPADACIVVFCHLGIRSREAAHYLRLNGHPNALSMTGGVTAWSHRVDPTLPTY